MSVFTSLFQSPTKVQHTTAEDAILFQKVLTQVGKHLRTFGFIRSATYFTRIYHRSFQLICFHKVKGCSFAQITYGWKDISNLELIQNEKLAGSPFKSFYIEDINGKHIRISISVQNEKNLTNFDITPDYLQTVATISKHIDTTIIPFFDAMNQHTAAAKDKYKHTTMNVLSYVASRRLMSTNAHIRQLWHLNILTYVVLIILLALSRFSIISNGYHLWIIYLLYILVSTIIDSYLSWKYSCGVIGWHIMPGHSGALWKILMNTLTIILSFLLTILFGLLHEFPLAI
jgi:hypothetical protein